MKKFCHNSLPKSSPEPNLTIVGVRDRNYSENLFGGNRVHSDLVMILSEIAGKLRQNPILFGDRRNARKKYFINVTFFLIRDDNDI